MQYYFAPMEGVAGAVYRRVHHAFFPGIDKYFIPFITPTTTGRLTPRQLRDVAPAENEGVPAVPQLLTRTAADFIWVRTRCSTWATARSPQPRLPLGHGDRKRQGRGLSR